MLMKFSLTSLSYPWLYGKGKNFSIVIASMMFSAFLWWKQLWIGVKAHFSQHRNICPLPYTPVPSIKVCTCKSTNYRRFFLSVGPVKAEALSRKTTDTLLECSSIFHCNIINQYDYYLSFYEGITSWTNCHESDELFIWDTKWKSVI